MFQNRSTDLKCGYMSVIKCNSQRLWNLIIAREIYSCQKLDCSVFEQLSSFWHKILLMCTVHIEQLRDAKHLIFRLSRTLDFKNSKIQFLNKVNIKIIRSVNLTYTHLTYSHTRSTTDTHTHTHTHTLTHTRNEFCTPDQRSSSYSLKLGQTIIHLFGLLSLSPFSPLSFFSSIHLLPDCPD